MKRNIALIYISLVYVSHSIAATNETMRTHQLEEIVVLAERLQPLNASQSRDELTSDSRIMSAAHAAQNISGVGASYRSIDAPEVSIRGLGWERVPTQLDFLPLYGSCPARMDPPATYISPDSIANLTVVKGLPSVTYGSGGTGGRAMARTVSNATQPTIDGFGADAGVLWNGGRDGYTSRIGGTVGNGKMEAGINANTTDLSDYESGDGRTVPAENRSHGASATLRFTPDANNGYFMNLNLHKVDHLDYPALPMDATDVTSRTFTFGSHHVLNRNRLKDIQWQAGYASSDHTMDNAQKPNQPRADNSADTESETFGARMASGWRFSDNAKWIFGLDGHHLNRDGRRTRVVKVAPPAPGTYYDPIWPDADQGQLGLFTERAAELSNNQRLRLGLRADLISSAIGRGDEPTPFDPTVKDGYARYYGEDARDTDRNEFLLSGNALWEISQGDYIEWFAGAGVVQRAASITERFYAYAPAPGGFQVGNPTLDPETKAELDGGIDVYCDSFEIGLHAYIAHVSDYILETEIGAAPNGAPVRGFVNTDALLAGGEVDGNWRLGDSWSVSFSAAYVRGRNIEDDRDLPLIPPVSGRLALRWDSVMQFYPWAETIFRAAAPQNHVDDLFPETKTAGWQVIDLRGGITLPGGFRLEVGIENLFNQDYAEHLSRTVPLPVGDLQAGERVPMPGRYFYAGLNWSM